MHRQRVRSQSFEFFGRRANGSLQFKRSYQRRHEVYARIKFDLTICQPRSAGWLDGDRIGSVAKPKLDVSVDNI